MISIGIFAEVQITRVNLLHQLIAIAMHINVNWLFIEVVSDNHPFRISPEYRLSRLCPSTKKQLRSFFFWHLIILTKLGEAIWLVIMERKLIIEPLNWLNQLVDLVFHRANKLRQI